VYKEIAATWGQTKNVVTKKKKNKGAGSNEVKVFGKEGKNKYGVGRQWEGRAKDEGAERWWGKASGKNQNGDRLGGKRRQGRKRGERKRKKEQGKRKATRDSPDRGPGPNE